MTQTDERQPLFELKSITKEFPNVRALKNVDFSAHRGEILALIGENGAGKSTLLRIMNGDYQPDSGELYYEGNRVRFHSPRDAHHVGVRVIYQEPEIAPDLSVAENLYINELPKRFGHIVDWTQLYKNAREQLAKLGLDRELSMDAKAGTLTPAQKQLVEILRALKDDIKVLALDEPTSSLADEEVDRLFAILRRLRDSGVAIIYVSHRLREIVRLSDRVAILRDGEMITVRPAKELTERQMMSQMVGRPLSDLFNPTSYATSDVVLRVRNLTGWKLKDISFDLHKGEVLGVAGLIGAGRTTLGKTLFGVLPATAGTIEIEGRPVHIRQPSDAMDAGLCYTPEDRKGEALFSVLSVKENTSLAILDRLQFLHFVNFRREEDVVSEMTKRLRVKTPSLSQLMGKLSGGNQQKVVLARWLARSPKVLILDEPTRGIDVGAKAEIYALIKELAAQGYALMFISSELSEILGMSDRILVMHMGRITGELSRAEASEEVVLRLAMADHLTQEPEAQAVAGH
jgi:L-arabinose transport system ATP-binding protein